MYKWLLLLALVFYVFYKVTSFFFKAGVASGQNKQPLKEKKPKPNGNIKGGDYIDYEEVK